ncbi:hypothetical protein QWZ10_12125 [Paracoccus cavernae]|uniref:Uncharacterized protein n=1 Tax=Paracoccus cavernae TaxID=1571207 RepID=A0ABT8D6D9_9RHOB|nr:hypothetical protein [Paracoccus cavernae]
MHRSGGASHDDTWSLPGDTEEEVGDRDLFAPSEPVDLPPDQPYMEIGAGADTKPSAAALPDTTAASANAAPVAAPAPQAPTEEPPAHGPRHFLPATVTEDDIPAGAAGYRTGFAIAVMLMLLAVTFTSSPPPRRSGRIRRADDGMAPDDRSGALLAARPDRGPLRRGLIRVARNALRSAGGSDCPLFRAQNFSSSRPR